MTGFSFGSQANTQPTEPHQPGHDWIFLRQFEKDFLIIAKEVHGAVFLAYAIKFILSMIYFHEYID